MSELNHLYNAEKIICADLHMGMGNKVLKVCLKDTVVSGAVG